MRSSLLFILICVNPLTALSIPQPEKLNVSNVEGEVLVYWKQPADAPLTSKYNVQMAKLTDKWAKVPRCTEITNTYCDISGLIHDYTTLYKVRVQLAAGEHVSPWAARKIPIYDSYLLPPSFTLLATSNSLSVHVHEKPILKKIFSFGLTYTIYLKEPETEKVTTAYLEDEVEEDQRRKTFTSLQWGKQYCVSMTVEGNGGILTSAVSPKQCLLLPDREWFMISVSSFSILGVFVIITIGANILWCYLKRPEKTPIALKSPACYWQPLCVEEGIMETVTDKGWFLSNHRAEVKDCIHTPVTQTTLNNATEEEDRRTSMDSGVSIETSSPTNDRGSSGMKQEDSGFGSIGVPEGFTCSKTDYPLEKEKAAAAAVEEFRKRQDSGLGLSCQTDLDQLHTRLLKDSVPSVNYRTQRPPDVQIHVPDEEEEFKQKSLGTVLADVVTGYRAGPRTCICSGAGQCTWCLTQGQAQGQRGTEAVSVENGLLRGTCDVPDICKEGRTFLSCYKKAQIDTVTIDTLQNSFTQGLQDTFPLLKTVQSLSLLDVAHDLNMNHMTLSLSDVQVETD